MLNPHLLISQLRPRREPQSGLSYLPRLDGLRCIAVFGVLIEHFCPNGKIRALSPGGAGVSLFFVLSGYLITRILLNYRRAGATIGGAARHFYTRRFLRLSPPYYIAIAVAAFFGLHGLDKKWWIPAFYLTNFHIVFIGAWPGVADHFWSLAVEEQFYIIWFIAVVILPTRFFIPSVACAMTTGVVFRLIVYTLSLSPLTTVLLLGHLNTLSAGGLIAYAEIAPSFARVQSILVSRPLLVISGIAFAAVSLSLPFLLFPRVVIYPLVASLFFACLVRQAADPSRHAWLDWLRWRPLTHVGKISYGIFVYHMFIPVAAISAVVGRNKWAIFAGLVAASVAVAEVSWFGVEERVLKYKDKLTGTFHLENERVDDSRLLKTQTVSNASRLTSFPEQSVVPNSSLSAFEETRD
jgi:peptidoglycan/LPS O-acetylase OafA/YrhL